MQSHDYSLTDNADQQADAAIRGYNCWVAEREACQLAELLISHKHSLDSTTLDSSSGLSAASLRHKIAPAHIADESDGMHTWREFISCHFKQPYFGPCNYFDTHWDYREDNCCRCYDLTSLFRTWCGCKISGRPFPKLVLTSDQPPGPFDHTRMQRPSPFDQVDRELDALAMKARVAWSHALADIMEGQGKDFIRRVALDISWWPLDLIKEVVVFANRIADAKSHRARQLRALCDYHSDDSEVSYLFIDCGFDSPYCYTLRYCFPC
jgi:hypothetical protein